MLACISQGFSSLAGNFWAGIIWLAQTFLAWIFSTCTSKVLTAAHLAETYLVFNFLVTYLSDTSEVQFNFGCTSEAGTDLQCVGNFLDLICMAGNSWAGNYLFYSFISQELFHCTDTNVKIIKSGSPLTKEFFRGPTFLTSWY